MATCPLYVPQMSAIHFFFLRMFFFFLRLRASASRCSTCHAARLPVILCFAQDDKRCVWGAWGFVGTAGGVNL